MDGIDFSALFLRTKLKTIFRIFLWYCIIYLWHIHSVWLCWFFFWCCHSSCFLKVAFHFFQSWIAFVFNRILPFHGLLFRIAALTTRRFARIPSSRNEWRHEKDLDFVCSKTKHKKTHKIDDPIKKWRFVGVSFSHTFFSLYGRS